MADFKDQPSAGLETVEGLRDEAADEVEAIGTGKQGEGGIVHDLAGEGGALGLGDVGEIRDDAVERCFDGGEEVAVEKGGVGNFQQGGIFLGEGEGIRGDIGKGEIPAGAGGGEGESEHAGAAAHVEDGLGGGEFPREDPLGEFLGLRAGNEGAGVGLEFVFVEPDGAEQVLEWDAFAAFFEGFTEGDEVGFFDFAVKLQVKIHAGAAQLAGDEHLHVAAGVVDAAFFEIAGAAIDGFQNGAHS